MTLKEALATFRAAQANLERVIATAPRGDAGRFQFEEALTAAVEAGDRMQELARKVRSEGVDGKTRRRKSTPPAARH